jgi:hypothetical protein
VNFVCNNDVLICVRISDLPAAPGIRVNGLKARNTAKEHLFIAMDPSMTVINRVHIFSADNMRHLSLEY